jgi:(5-formylfuran-3-yl)methyl phosphate synthase
LTRLLISVRSVEEAQLAAAGGADFIDCKEPGQGALGGLPVPVIAAIVRSLRDAGRLQPVSATIGDLPMTAQRSICSRVDAVAACGVDYVKVGIEREASARPVLEALAASGHAVVPVFIVDRGLDQALVDHALALGFAGVMVDSADKRAGCLFDLLPMAAIAGFVAAARRTQTMVGVAGALRIADLPQVAALGPDFAGFRSAVCACERSAALDSRRLHELAAAMRGSRIGTDPALPVRSQSPRGQEGATAWPLGQRPGGSVGAQPQAPIGRSSPSSSERTRASSVR